MVCVAKNDHVIQEQTKHFEKLRPSKNCNHDVARAHACPDSLSNIRVVSLQNLPGHDAGDVKMAFQVNKVKTDAKNLTPAPDRPRIFMSNKTSKVVVVFPNGEVVEGKFMLNFLTHLPACLIDFPIIVILIAWKGKVYKRAMDSSFCL